MRSTADEGGPSVGWVMAAAQHRGLAQEGQPIVLCCEVAALPRHGCWERPSWFEQVRLLEQHRRFVGARGEVPLKDESMPDKVSAAGAAEGCAKIFRDLLRTFDHSYPVGLCQCGSRRFPPSPTPDQIWNHLPDCLRNRHEPWVCRGMHPAGKGTSNRLACEARRCRTATRPWQGRQRGLYDLGSSGK